MAEQFSYDELLNAVNWLWGYMGADEVKQIREDDPELYDLCGRVHERVCHDEHP